jgi:hypothetical protein
MTSAKASREYREAVLRPIPILGAVGRLAGAWWLEDNLRVAAKETLRLKTEAGRLRKREAWRRLSLVRYRNEMPGVGRVMDDLRIIMPDIDDWLRISGLGDHPLVVGAFVMWPLYAPRRAAA